MNKIITKDHICTFCDSRAKPIPDGDFIKCPCCGISQFEGIEYQPDVPVKELECRICKMLVEPKHQLRLDADESGGNGAVIHWYCPKCGVDNLTADDLEILEADILL